MHIFRPGAIARAMCVNVVDHAGVAVFEPSFPCSKRRLQAVNPPKLRVSLAHSSANTRLPHYANLTLPKIYSLKIKRVGCVFLFTVLRFIGFW